MQGKNHPFLQPAGVTPHRPCLCQSLARCILWDSSRPSTGTQSSFPLKLQPFTFTHHIFRCPLEKKRLDLRLPAPLPARKSFSAALVHPAVPFKQRHSWAQVSWRVLREDPPAPGLPQEMICEAMGHGE